MDMRFKKKGLQMIFANLAIFKKNISSKWLKILTEVTAFYQNYGFFDLLENIFIFIQSKKTFAQLSSKNGQLLQKCN